MLGRDGHGQWNPDMQEDDDQTLGRDGHGQWNPDIQEDFEQQMLGEDGWIPDN